MLKTVGVALIIMTCSVCHAKKYASYTNYSAQGVANIMAQRNSVGHFGGNSYMYEGCGSGHTKEQAYNNCCFSNSGLRVVDVGYARGSNGLWYCCKRYISK